MNKRADWLRLHIGSALYGFEIAMLALCTEFELGDVEWLIIEHALGGWDSGDDFAMQWHPPPPGPTRAELS